MSTEISLERFERRQERGDRRQELGDGRGVREEKEGEKTKGESMATQRFEDVMIWQKAHAWLLEVYRITERFPKSKMFGLTSQPRRAAVSIPENFVEGYKKSGDRDKIRFFNSAQGSLEECRYYSILSRDLGYAETHDLSPPLSKRSVVCSPLTFAPSRPAALSPTGE